MTDIQKHMAFINHSLKAIDEKTKQIASLMDAIRSARCDIDRHLYEISRIDEEREGE